MSDFENKEIGWDEEINNEGQDFEPLRPVRMNLQWPRWNEPDFKAVRRWQPVTWPIWNFS